MTRPGERYPDWLPRTFPDSFMEPDRIGLRPLAARRHRLRSGRRRAASRARPSNLTMNGVSVAVGNADPASGDVCARLARPAAERSLRFPAASGQRVAARRPPSPKAPAGMGVVAGCPAACRPVVLEQAALVPSPSAVRADGASRPSQQHHRRTRAHEEKQCQDNMAVLEGEFMRLQGQDIPQIPHGNA